MNELLAEQVEIARKKKLTSAGVQESARKIERQILTKLAEVGQTNVASLAGTSEGTLSKQKDGPIELLSRIIAAAGLKVVPAEYRCVDPVVASAFITLYQASFNKMKNPSQLLWDDEDQALSGPTSQPAEILLSCKVLASQPFMQLGA